MWVKTPLAFSGASIQTSSFKTLSQREADLSALQVTQTTCTLVFPIEGEAGKEPKNKNPFSIKTCAKIASEKNETTCKQTLRQDHQSSGTPCFVLSSIFL